jgi:3-dehydroquinate synthase
MHSVKVRLKEGHNYEIRIGNGLLSEIGSEVRASLGSSARRVVVISNKTVFSLFGKNAMRSLRASGFNASTWFMEDGEQHKSMRSLEKALSFLSEAGLERGDAIVALGGGVVGDVAGFAAAVYLRGIAFVQVPTTLLAQIDASVGGKTAVNMPAGKNLVGAFHQPKLVLIDPQTLQTLPRRERTSGWCEALKQGAAGDRKLFDQTVRLLRRIGTHASSELNAGGAPTEEVCAAIATHCRFKASIVAGDEREEISRDDHRSRRILNFGHTIAHALENVTGYRRFRHGEAVGYGMLVAGEISKDLGMLPSDELELLREAVRLCGRLPSADDLSTEKIAAAVKLDKKSVGGIIKWVLLERIGRARIVSGHEIDKRVIRSSIRAGLRGQNRER